MNFPLNSFMMIPDGTRRQELIFQLINLLNSVKCTLLQNEDEILFTLINPNQLGLEHLEVISSLSKYITYLIKIFESYQQDEDQLNKKKISYFN
ncbi:unnamed protein product [Rotaria sp. Silwood2]|nr:unnamed protein product [Rotaria sp. Silwood2]CAF2926128.1 unnamed protein product [Rotaria sp. Silwood2]CAF3935806.1 unnamed protein product [Rotaria sp. Silwood2]CAF4180771.1 unnamed protein product [Rotaria sp. Silwood2]